MKMLNWSKGGMLRISADISHLSCQMSIQMHLLCVSSSSEYHHSFSSRFGIIEY